MMPYGDDYQYGGLLSKNLDKNFIKRIINPQDYPALTYNKGTPDEYRETHLMSAEIDPRTGKSYAFPTVVQQEDGTLKKFDNPFEALRYNIERGEAIEFPSIDEAVKFTEGYKTNEFLQNKPTRFPIPRGLLGQ